MLPHRHGFWGIARSVATGAGLVAQTLLSGGVRQHQPCLAPLCSQNLLRGKIPLATALSRFQGGDSSPRYAPKPPPRKRQRLERGFARLGMTGVLLSRREVSRPPIVRYAPNLLRAYLQVGVSGKST